MTGLRFAWRGLSRDRGFAAAAIAMLAVAVGLNVTVFTVMRTMLFRGFPVVQENSRLLYMQERFPSGLCCLSYLDFEDWRAQAHSFEALAFVAGKPIRLSVAGRWVDTFATTVSSNVFKLLRVAPLMGRDFTPQDEAPGAPPVVILNYRFWVSQFGRRPDIVGTATQVGGAPATIIGVMPEGFDFPQRGILWMPLPHTPELNQRGPGAYMAVGRLRDGATARQARAELAAINQRLEVQFPATNRRVLPRVDTYAQFFIGPDASITYGSLWTAAWFVLLIACANLANLTLARTVGRWRDFSTRIALGAGRGRMIRQVLLENLTLAAIAGVIAWWIVKWSVSAWAVATESQYQVLDYRVDSITLAYLMGVSIAAAILFSLAPAARIWRMGISGSLQGGERGATQTLRGKRLAAVLVTVQTALAIVLLCGAGVLARSIFAIVHADTGVRDPGSILTGALRLPSDKYPDAESKLRYLDRIEARWRAVPGVEDISLSNTLPVGSVGLQEIEIEGGAPVPAQIIAAGPDYFRVVGSPPLSGRVFNAGDRAGSLPVAIVNQSFVETYLPGAQPLGRRVRVKYRGNRLGDWLTVVGVAGNIMEGDPLRQHFKPLVYVPFRQQASVVPFFLLRTGVPPEQLAPEIRAEIQNLDPDVALEDFETLKASFSFNRDRMDIEHAELGKHASVAPIFAGIALLLAAVGLYAVVAHSVSQRTREIGVRMAIGAAAEDIRRLIFREGMTPVAAGLLVGLAAALGLNRILESQLVGVTPYDPLTMAAAPSLLIVVALLGCRIPARRAMRVDPAVALRHD